MSDIQAQLLAAFEVEQREHLAAIRAVLARVSPGRPADLADAFRRAHSLKGAARAVGFPQVEAAAHRLESLFSSLVDNGSVLDAGMLAAAVDLVDGLDGSIAEAAAPPAEEAAPAEEAPAQPTVEYLRVAAPHVEALGRSLRELLGEVQSRVVLEEGLADLDAEARELRRSLAVLRRAETAGDAALAGFERSLEGFGRRLASLRRTKRQADATLERVTRRLREDVERVSLMPVGDVFAGFGKAVRDLVRSEGREIEFHFRGAEVEAARDVLQQLKDPVLHMLRNAVGHGVEPPDRREAAGKPRAGTVILTCSIAGDRLLVSVSDDGRGPDLDRIASVARARGLIPPGADPMPEDLLALVFHPGFSTSGAVDRLSGRGVGLAVAAAAVERLRGTVSLRPQARGGAIVEMAVPLSGAIQPLLIVESGGRLFGLPSSGVERLIRVPAALVERLEGGLAVRVADGGRSRAYPLVPLGRLAGFPASEVPIEAGHVNAALVRAGARHCAIAVDAFVEARSMLVSSVEAFGADRVIIAGATIHHDMAVPVLDPAGLVERGLAAGPTRASLGDFSPAVAARPKTILVVDDSITTRTLEKSILEAQGYRVTLCVDGLDALETLRNGALVDLAVIDVEMPRMDGFSLLQALKTDPRFQRLPVVMMTSRADPADVRRGLDLGADAYIAKQTFDQRELLATIGQLL